MIEESITVFGLAFAFICVALVSGIAGLIYGHGLGVEDAEQREQERRVSAGWLPETSVR